MKLEGQFQLVTVEPKPLFLVPLAEVDEYLPRLDWIELFKAAGELVPALTLPSLANAQCRGVPFGDLDTVLQTGIDVEPTTHHIWVDDFEKAMEYGGWPKVLLVIGNEGLDSTYRVISSDQPTAEIQALRRKFPTELLMADGSRLLSRLPPEAAGSPYEVAHARWIPGSALAALRCVFLMTHPHHGGVDAVKSKLERLSAAQRGIP